ncbi:transposase [Streptomyces sp. NPDC048301]|uniref:transposase n=1 Tax=Streptomyces sp. NPDC048301 TaxID=3155631 RepID=UPI00342EC19C
MIDSQSVTAGADADSRGFYGGTLVDGRKRQVVVDSLGLLLGVMVASADTGDRAAAKVLRTTPPAGSVRQHLLEVLEAGGTGSWGRARCRPLCARGGCPGRHAFGGDATRSGWFRRRRGSAG